VQGQAFLVTFAAIGKSDWPRAAIERARGRRTNSAMNELGWYQLEVRWDRTLRATLTPTLVC
jgi:hypothetical protein